MVGAGVDIVLRCMWDRELNHVSECPSTFIPFS